MNSEYEIFECLEDGSVKWCDRVVGLRNARLKLDGLPRNAGNEYFAMHMLTRHIIFAADVTSMESGRALNRIFQIAYAKQLRVERDELLRGLGYPVISVLATGRPRFSLTHFAATTLASPSLSWDTQPRRKPEKRWSPGSGQIIQEQKYSRLIRLVNKSRLPITT